MTVSVARVQQQKEGRDCGLFSVAFAFDLAHGIEPQYVNYIQSEMRKHLKTCIQQGTITSFPRNFPSKQVIRRCSSSVLAFPVYCSCRMTETFGRPV